MVATHQKLLHTKHKLAMLIFSDISDIISEEVHGTVGPILRQLHDDTPKDSPAHGLVKFMATEHGQLQALAGTAAGASGLFSSVGQVVNNELSPSVRGLLASNPHLLPDPGTLAELAARGLADQHDALQSIAEQGINTGWGNALIELNKQYPDMATMLELMRRGKLGRDTYIEWSIRQGIPAAVADVTADLIAVPLSPADAALALLRGNMSEGAALKAAADWGVNADDFNVMVGNTGEPLGLEQLLEAHRRGFIDTQRLVRGIIQSRVRNEWVDVAEKLAFAPMSTAEAVEAVVQNQLSFVDGERYASQNGLEAGMFQTLVNTAGSPLSRTEMEQLYNRGEATQAEVEQALRESRLKNKYVSKAFQLHSRLVTPGELADAVVYGAMTHAAAVQEVMHLGYVKEHAEILISSAVNRKLLDRRKAIVTAIEQLYEDNGIQADQAGAAIGKLGFDATEVSLILQHAEFRRKDKLVRAGIVAIRGKYIAHHIDAKEASSKLDQLGIAHQWRDSIIQIWQLEQEANVRQLTEAQILKGNKKGALSDPETISRLMNLGLSKPDAEFLLATE
jgi:hypothetical protein